MWKRTSGMEKEIPICNCFYLIVHICKYGLMAVNCEVFVSTIDAISCNIFENHSYPIPKHYED